MNPVCPTSLPALGRTALIFAHPAHEWFTLRAMLRFQPDVYYLSRGAYTNADFDDAFCQAWENVGFRGTMTFGDASEADIFQHYLNHDHAWFAQRRDHLGHWLNKVQPNSVFTDPFEWYNSAHDAVPLLLASALQQQTTCKPQLWEHGIAIHTIEPELQGNLDWPAAQLDEEELQIKRDLLVEMGKLSQTWAHNVNDELTSVVASWSETQIRTEYYRPVTEDYDFTSLPTEPIWDSYDKRGKKRVADGRASEAILFQQHFQPLAESLLSENQQADVA